MTSVAADPWTRKWSIVRSDMDIAHVMLPLSDFRLQITSASGSPPVYQFVQSADTPVPDCLVEAQFQPVGAAQPTFFDITRMKTLPPYTQDTDSAYVDVSDLLSTYLTANTTVQRLEGQIRMAPAGPEAAKRPGMSLAGGAFTTTLHLYQFSNAVEGGVPLLLVRAPITGSCLTNGDGTAMGVGKN